MSLYRRAGAHLWSEKYRPRSLSEVVNQDEVKKRLVEWMKQWISGNIPEKKAVLLTGPPGTGKTTIAHALANDFNFEVLELNASDVRTGERIRQVVGRALREGSLFGYRGKIILMDEVDGLSVKEDAGGLAAILEIIQESRCPIIMTANNPWDPKFKQLREVSEVISVKPLEEHHVISLLRRICSSEGIECEEEALRLIARASGGDMRAAINDLQAAAQGKKVLTKDDVIMLSDRAHQYDMFKLVDKAFRIRRAEEIRSIQFLPSFDWEQFLPWAAENVSIYKNNPIALFDACTNLSLADVIRGRIIRSQTWELMPYMVELMIGGVSLVRDKPSLPRFVKFKFPERLLMLTRLREYRQLRESIINRLRQELHASSREVILEYLPLLKVLSMSREHADKVLQFIARSFGHRPDDVKRALKLEVSEAEAKREDVRTSRRTARRSSRS